MKTLRLENIRKQYENFNFYINELSFTERRIYVVTGPNASGKSTMLNTIALADLDFKGDIYFEGFPLSCLSKKDIFSIRRRIGYLKQDNFLFNDTVLGNITYGPKVRGIKNSKDSIKHIADSLRITHLYSRNIKSLSGGEARRVKIAQILSFNPDILLLDEPMTGIDRASAAIIRNMLADIVKIKNKMIIMTAHNIDEAYRFSGNVICISGGKVVLKQTK